jgi:hypothetical protein
MALVVDAYGYDAGTQVCVHVDVLLDQQPAEDDPAFDCNVHGNGLCSADDTTPYEEDR